MTDVIIFIDALSPREASGALSDIQDGEMDSRSPRVTPRVMSSIYTGLSPSENGMMEISKRGSNDTTRPKKSTFIDQMVREGMSVLSMGMPFCIPFQSTNDDSVIHGTALGGKTQFFPEESEGMVRVPAPEADMVRSHPDRVFASFKDQTHAYFNVFKENIRRVEPDVALLGYRLVDSYCHFQHTEARAGKEYRQHLIDEVAMLVDRVRQQIDGDLLFFSDHGQTKVTDVFRVNRWLKRKGYLSYKVDYDFIDTFEEWQGEDHPVDERVENQVTINSPGVTIDEDNSDVVCADPFDSSLTLLTDKSEFDAEAFRDDLLSTGMYRSVDYRWELYNEDDDYYDTVPHVIPDRDEGVFVSGNLHENPIGMGYYRTGVHDYKACFGATCDLTIPSGKGRGGRIIPEQMHEVITDFIGLDVTTSPIDGEQMKGFTDTEMELAHKRLEEEMQA